MTSFKIFFDRNHFTSKYGAYVTIMFYKFYLALTRGKNYVIIIIILIKMKPHGPNVSFMKNQGNFFIIFDKVVNDIVIKFVLLPIILKIYLNFTYIYIQYPWLSPHPMKHWNFNKYKSGTISRHIIIMP